MSESTKKILYAEDEALTRTFVSRLLGRYYNVVDAANGEEALEKYQEGGFDLLVTDLSMPVMDGFMLINEIRKINEHLPIVVTTAFREEAEKIRNVAKIVEKPVTFEELISAVRYSMVS